MDMNQLADQVSNLADFVWNGLLLYLLVGTGIIFTIRTRFIQVRKFGTGFKRLFGSFSLNGEKAGKEGMSSFQAVATSIAAQVGTGNITGCATAMISGGPGARLCHRHDLRRPGSYFLDVGGRLLRHGHHLRRGLSGSEVQDRG